MLRAVLALLALLTLAACGAEPKWAPEEQVQAARYVHDGPPAITLFTVINNRSNAGAHSGLMINGSERIMFDPAGTWQHPRIPERNDVHYGITPRIVNFYIDYHARETYRVIEQTVREKLPEGFQRAEFLLDKGAIDMIVHRKHLRDELSSLLRLLRKEPVCS